MRNDADFVAYLAARWPFLVRTLVLLGSPPYEAESVARTGMARCYAAWDTVLEADDVDVCVYRVVLECWHRSRRGHRWVHRRGETADALAPDAEVGPAAPGDALLLRRALAADLDRLAPEHREVLVLRFVADLSEAQVADVLEVTNGVIRERTAQALAHIDLAALREMTGR